MAFSQKGLGNSWSVGRDEQGFVGPRTCTEVAPRTSVIFFFIFFSGERFPQRTERNLSKRTVLVPGSVIDAPHEGRAEYWRQEPLCKSRRRILPGAFTEQTALSEAIKGRLNNNLW